MAVMQNTQHGISCLHCVLSVRDERSDIHAMVSACSSLTLTTKPKMTVLVLVTLLALGSLTLTAQPAAAQEQQENATLPISYPATVLEGDSETCASIEEREMARTQNLICEATRECLSPYLLQVFPFMST